jgi:signal transduction histidine kinase
LKIQIDVARKLYERDSDKSKEALDNAKELAGKGLTDVRSIVRSMRDSDFDFRGELDSLLENFEKSSPIKVDLNCEVAKLPDPIGHQLFCIVQECLTNVQRHAHATLVVINFQKVSEKVFVEIRDNGQGFEDAVDQDGFGIKGMKERAQSIGGSFAIESSPTQGTKISVCVPGI